MTGEMNKYDIEEGGDWFEIRKDFENICEQAGVTCEVRPFDQYQGPYAIVFGFGELWLYENEYEYEYILKGRNEFTGNKQEMIAFLKELDSVKV